MATEFPEQWNCMGNPEPGGTCDHGVVGPHKFWWLSPGVWTLQKPEDGPQPTLAAHKSEGKPLVGDIDPKLELAIGQVLAASIGKYPNDPDGMPNWWKGGSYRGFAASVRRHMDKWLSGEELDDESGLPHLYHAATDVMFLLSWQDRGVGADDRLRRNQ